MNGNKNILVVFVLSLFTIFFASIVIGTIVWLLWPYVVTSVAPGMVEQGMLSADINLLQSIAITFLCGILFKNNVSNK